MPAIGKPSDIGWWENTRAKKASHPHCSTTVTDGQGRGRFGSENASWMHCLGVSSLVTPSRVQLKIEFPRSLILRSATGHYAHDAGRRGVRGFSFSPARIHHGRNVAQRGKMIQRVVGYTRGDWKHTETHDLEHKGAIREGSYTCRSHWTGDG